MKFQNLAIAAALGSASALAVAGGFDGPFVQLGIGGAGTSSKVSGVPASSTGADLNGTDSQGSFNGLVAAGYSQDLGALNSSLGGLNLAANIFYVIGEQKAGSKTSSGVNQWNDSLTLSGKNKLNNTFGISIEPGWNFTKETLGYLKLAWVNTQLKGTLSYNYVDAGDPAQSTSGSDNSSKNINGFGYGLGVKQMITSNIFASVDLMGVSYQSYKNDGISVKPSQFMGFASLGYKF